MQTLVLTALLLFAVGGLVALATLAKTWVEPTNTLPIVRYLLIGLLVILLTGICTIVAWFFNQIMNMQ